MTMELLIRENRPRVQVVAGSIIAGCFGALAFGLASCSPEPVPIPAVAPTSTNSSLIPPLPPKPIVVASSAAATVRRAMVALAASAPALSVASSVPISVIGVAPYNGRSQVSLAWNASIDPTVTGYRVYFGTASGQYTNSINVGLALKCAVTGLLEGVKYYFACVAYDANGVESIPSNEVSATTAFYISIRASSWSVETYGQARATNQLLKSTNLTSWSVVKEFVGVAGVLTNISEPNAANAYYRVVVKP